MTDQSAILVLMVIFKYTKIMTLQMETLVMAIAVALDIVEGELVGASTNHGKRIAVLCAKMGRALGFSPQDITFLAICALLHDSALTEYIMSERMNRNPRDSSLKDHCEYGQRNVDALHLKNHKTDFVLYHHEKADGSGPFGIREGEGSLEAELIAIADSIDVTYHLQQLSPDSLPDVRNVIAARTGEYYSKAASKAMLDVLDESMLLSLRDDVIMETVVATIPPWVVDVEGETIFGLAGLIPRIIDYKSVFTQRHSTQIANKAWFMGGYYNYDPLRQRELYLAAAFHDIGKLATPVEILEKPGSLTSEEFSIIKEHIRLTWDILKDIEGFDSVCAWASNHHEKLDGSGYPFGKKAEELDFNSRLMTCIDIYQAVSEDRPYHPGRNHRDTMTILYEMANNGKIDGAIVKDMDDALTPFDGGDLPSPQQGGTL